MLMQQEVNPYHAKVIYLNFHPLEVVRRGSDAQLQVGKNNLSLVNLRRNISKSWCLIIQFIPNNSDLFGKWNRLKTTIVALSVARVNVSVESDSPHWLIFIDKGQHGIFEQEIHKPQDA